MTALIELYANNAYSTLGSPISSSGQTTITVTNGGVFPSPTGNQFFRITVTLVSAPNTVIEIMYCTSRSGNNLTVIRGQEGTSATTWASGNLCANEATAGTYNKFVQSWVGTDTGVTNAYVVNTPQNTGLYAGMPCTFITLNSNTATNPTLSLNGTGPYWILNADGSGLVASQILAGAPISVIYDGVGNWRLQSPLGFTPPARLTGSRALVSDAVGRVANADTTSTQINYLSNWIRNMQESNGNPGWCVLPTGLMIQYGGVDIIGESTPVGFPTLFPNACITVIVSEQYAAGTWLGGNPTIHGASLSDVNGYYGYAYYWNSSLQNWVAPTPSGPLRQGYIAIGY